MSRCDPLVMRRVNSYVRVLGSLRKDHVVNGFRVVAVADSNEITYHMLAAMHAHMLYTGELVRCVDRVCVCLDELALTVFALSRGASARDPFKALRLHSPPQPHNPSLRSNSRFVRQLLFAFAVVACVNRCLLSRADQ